MYEGLNIEKPATGLRPRYIVDSLRKQEISEAISRYNGRDLCIPIEWIQEYNEIVEREKNNKPSIPEFPKDRVFPHNFKTDYLS